MKMGSFQRAGVLECLGKMPKKLEFMLMSIDFFSCTLGQKPRYM